MLHTVVTDIAFGESPRWRDGRIWFCDWLDGDVRSATPDGGDIVVEAHVDGFPVCIDWDAAGRLLIVNGSAKQLLRRGPDGHELVADLGTLSDRPWNEVVGHPDGHVFVNGVGFDMMAGEPPTTGQIAVVPVDGDARIVADGLSFPNGMAVGPDGTTLVVAESHASLLTSFTITDSGDLVDRRVFAEIPGSAPDGICFAADETVWYADVPNRRCRRVAPGGEVLETVDADRGCFSCALAPDGDLYITATVWDDDTFSTRRSVLYRRPAPVD